MFKGAPNEPKPFFQEPRMKFTVVNARVWGVGEEGVGG